MKEKYSNFIKKTKVWLIDKKYWLISFNKKPSIHINALFVETKIGKPLIESNGRVDVFYNVDKTIITPYIASCSKNATFTKL